MLAVHLMKTYCLPILLYGCEIWSMSPSDKHKVDVAWNNCFRKVFNACWRESVKPLLFYCNTMPASLLVEQRKMIFYNKTLHVHLHVLYNVHSSNIILRILCARHRNEAQKLSSMYHIFPGHSSSIDIKRAIRSSFAMLLIIKLLVLCLLISVFFCVYCCNVLLQLLSILYGNGNGKCRFI